MRRKALSLGAVVAFGLLFAANAADIAFKWDSSGRDDTTPSGVAANISSFDSVVRRASESSLAKAVRAAYRAMCESEATAVSTFSNALIFILK